MNLTTCLPVPIQKVLASHRKPTPLVYMHRLDRQVTKAQAVESCFYTLQAYVLHEWMLDFVPMSDREHLKLLIDVRDKLQKK